MNKMLIDFNQLAFANMYAQLGNIEALRIENPEEGGPLYQIDESLLRHMILNSIRLLRAQFKKDYPELIIACDGQKTWRRQVFPHYKHKRRKEKQTSQLAWNAIYDSMTNIRREIQLYFPYKVIWLQEAEADDIIATMVFLDKDHADILICSADKDFIQLHKDRPWVKQYDPIRKKYVTNKNPKEELLYHILRGDSSDGVPNVVSEDDCFVAEGKRQKPLTGKTIKGIIEGIKSGNLDETIKKNIVRNDMLINLNKIPANLVAEIAEHYENESSKETRSLLSYFMDKKLKLMLDSIGDF